jgi:hypothetical protein
MGRSLVGLLFGRSAQSAALLGVPEDVHEQLAGGLVQALGLTLAVVTPTCH